MNKSVLQSISIFFIGFASTVVYAQPKAQTISEEQHQNFSTAGFYTLPDKKSDRSVYNFNNNWYFHKGDMENAQKMAVNAKDWQQVQLPHGIDGALPEQASGGKNYQGVVWYKKYFKIPTDISQQKLSLHFEGIMGKCQIWLNGKLIKSHKGGYLPIIVNLAGSDLNANKENSITIKADNSDDGSYPPGKPQYTLDFTYFGGIYRDVWLIATNEVHITDAVQEGIAAGGGVFVHYENVNEQSAEVHVSTHIKNESKSNQELELATYLKDDEGNNAGKILQKITIGAGQSISFQQLIKVSNPKLWHPDRPYLYKLYTEVSNAKNEIIDGFYNRIGIRSIEFKDKEGFFLNGKHFDDKLMGANHHQDYAYIGNAVPNNLQWRDVKKLRDAGIRIIRLAHTPQDPAFMDACDELGVFVIVPTPGWQYWSEEASFADLVIQNNQQMIRRDRNHPCVIAWEPILNETWYSDDFAKRAYESVHNEYPFSGCVAACDINTPNWKLFDLIYAHALNKDAEKLTTKPLFTREWGDYVDDWNTHNSPSRVALSWGEIPQLIQGTHYANSLFGNDNFESFYQAGNQHIGGALWHSFDHQRGYHPDPFYGGIMDAFRQPKLSYYMFQTQEKASEYKKPEYTIHIAHEMTPFSPTDVTVYTNCDSIRLTYLGTHIQTKAVDHQKYKMPNAPLVFENMFHFPEQKVLAMNGKWENVYMLAEGYVNGKLVATEKKTPSKRPTKIKLAADMDGLIPEADGSTIIPVFAFITDDNGVIKRLNEETILFTVEGEGEIIGDWSTGANPRRIEWGSAPALIRTGRTAGEIKITARPMFEGINVPKGDVLVVKTTAPLLNTIAEPFKFKTVNESNAIKNKSNQKVDVSEDKMIKKKLKEVEKDQQTFQDKLKTKQ